MNEPILTVVGNLVADVEPRVSQAGKAWCTFRVASTPRVRDRQSGDWSDGEPLWLGCRAYGDIADHIVASLTKGTRVIMQGRLTQNTYTDSQGVQRTGLNFEVDAIGPELRFATAQVTRSSDRGSVGGFGPSSPSDGVSGGAMAEWAQPGSNASENGFEAGAAQMNAMYSQNGGWDDNQPF